MDAIDSGFDNVFWLHNVPRFLYRQGATTEGLKQAFTFLFTAPAIPLSYYGDEIGMSDVDDRTSP